MYITEISVIIIARTCRLPCDLSWYGRLVQYLFHDGAGSMTTGTIISREALEVTQPLDTGYAYQFEADQLDDIFACVRAHGFAVARNVISQEHCTRLQASVKAAIDPEGLLEPGKSDTHLRFIEASEPLLELFDNAPWFAIQKRFYGSEELTVHRSAAIIRNPGAPGMGWHTDTYQPLEPWYAPDTVLNRGQSLGGMFFYLTGCRPSHGGLCVIPDSHLSGWKPQGDFEFGRAGKIICRKGQTNSYIGADVPGTLPLVTQGTDLLLFDQRTYHCALPNHEPSPRLSCSLGFRADRKPFLCPWPLPAEAVELKKRLPEHLRPYFEHYASVLKPQEWDMSRHVR